jgi:hypothetical protein
LFGQVGKLSSEVVTQSKKKKKKKKKGLRVKQNRCESHTFVRFLQYGEKEKKEKKRKIFSAVLGVALNDR